MAKLVNLFRTKEGNARYDAHQLTEEFSRGCVLCEREALREFTYWKIIPNLFPYDRIASVHDMLIPKRHVIEDGLTEGEKEEFRDIKKTALNNYQFLFEPTQSEKSIPGHFHLHLIVSKEIECNTV